MKYNKLKIHLYPTVLISVMLLLTTCKRDERDNPWDRFAIITPDAWAPKAVQTSNIDITKHQVTWTYEGDNRIEGFRIDRKEGDSEWEFGVHTAEKDDRSWVDTNVIPDTSLIYTYKVYAVAGENKSSSIISSIDVEFPAPTNIDIEKISDISYKLTWADNSIGEQGFKIDRRTDNGDWQIAYGIVEANQTAFVDTNVFVSKSVLPVEYRVYAFYNDHNSGSLGISTMASINPPSNLEINHTSIASATLSWENNSARSKGFRVERRYEDRDWEILSTVKETNFIDNDFNLNALIYYRVCTIIGEYSSDFIENNFDATIPPPTNATLEQISDISYKLTWNDNAVGEHGYKIDRRIDNGSWQLEYGTVDADETFFVDENVFSSKNSINIEYRVYAYYNTFESAMISATTNAALTPPTNLEINQNSITSATISWTDNSTGEDGFMIERSYGDGNWNLLETTTTNTYTDNNFNLNTTVFYRVFAYANTYSSSSIEDSFISTIPSPSNFDISVSSPTSIELSWEFNHTGHQGFYIDRKVNDDAWQVAFATLQPQDLSYTDNSVSFDQNSSHTYRIYTFVNESNSTIIELTVAKPAVATATVTSIEGYSAISGGEVISDGGSPVIARGVCWGTETNPTLSDNHTTNGSGTGTYVSNIAGLDLSTTYYLRAYATSNAGTVYGEVESFTTLGLPEVTTAEVIDITGTSAKSGGNVVSDGGSDVTQRGLVWSTSPYPTLSNSYTSDGNGTGSFESTITELELGTKYYVRAYATNTYGTSYGDGKNFTTLNHPQVSTSPITTILSTTAISGGNVTNEGGSPITARGICWSTSQNPTISDNHTTDGSGLGVFESHISNLNYNQTYYVRAYATNSLSTSYGEQLSFTTLHPWQQKANFAGVNRSNAVGFSIGDKGYIGTGSNSGSLNDFWEYNSETNTWTQKADFAGSPRSNAVGFSIGDKGYIGQGYGSEGKLGDFWEYDPSTNVWSQKASVEPLYNSVGFSIGNKGYIGTGSDNSGETRRFYEYDPNTNIWTRKTDFGSYGITNAIGFSIGDKGYIGLGGYIDEYGNIPVYINSFWEYNPTSETWSQIATFPSDGRFGAINFTFYDKVYVGTGELYVSGAPSILLKDIWEYSPATNTWTKKVDFKGIARRGAVGFSIGNKGYIGTGFSEVGSDNTFWEYDPSLDTK
jgi:N-acetylneuraminic acid mutarotase